MNYWVWGGKYAGKGNGDILYSRTGKPIESFISMDCMIFQDI